METKTIQDMLQLHQEFIQIIQKFAEPLAKGTSLSPELILTEQESLLGHLEERLSAAREAKKEALAKGSEERTSRRFEIEIENQERNISSLKEAIEKEREVLKRAPSGPEKS